MENQTQAAKRRMFHLQVAGEYSQEDLSNLVLQFQKTLETDGVIATPNNVTANVIETPEDLSGLILTPKMTAKEVATVAIAAVQGYAHDGPLDNQVKGFAELDAEAQADVLNQLQCVLRFGGLPPSEDRNSVHDAIFASTVKALANKMAMPDFKKVIEVTRINGETCSFLDLVAGDIFTHDDKKFVALSAPYVNWVADPLPIITIDAEYYGENDPAAEEQAEASADQETDVQSKASES